MTTNVRATMWSDGLFRFVDDPLEGGTHGAGRWRLSGDTLWWGADYRYGNVGLYNRGELPGPVLDTLEMHENWPVNDSLFWTAPAEKRNGMPEGGGYWHRTAYKVSMKDGQLIMVRMPDLSNNDWNPPGGAWERKK